jgi:hypothetical protein
VVQPRHQDLQGHIDQCKISLEVHHAWHDNNLHPQSSWCQAGVDIIILLCLKTESLSPKTVSGILIQVKNASKYGNKVKADSDLFEKLCPFKLGMFDDNATPRPIILMVFALTSQKSGVCFQTVDKTCGEFTAFNIWCGGLSCFCGVDEKDLASYRVLLDHSLEPHHAFVLKR